MRSHSFVIALPRGFRPAPVLRFLGRDAESACERVDASGFTKAVDVEGESHLLRARFERSEVRVDVASPRRLTASAKVRHLRTVERLCGLDSPASAFEARGTREPEVARLVRPSRGLRIPQTATVFESLVWAICGQQVNLAFAMTLRRRLIGLARRDGTEFTPHPSAADVARLTEAQLRGASFSAAKAGTMLAVARAVATGEFVAEELPNRPAEEAERALLALKGVGPWTANYVMMRGCGFADCVPVGDSGLATSLQSFYDLPKRPDAARTRELMEPFAPHRSLATAHFWERLHSQ